MKNFNKRWFSLTYFFLLNPLYSQTDETNLFKFSSHNIFSLPRNQNSIDNSSAKGLDLSFNAHQIINNGHANIDNNGEIFITGKNAYFLSAGLKYSNKWFKINFEPYVFRQKEIIEPFPEFSSLYLTNNQ